MRRTALAAVMCLATAAVAADFPPDRAQKVLRYAFERAETTLDPQKTSDVYSNFVESAIFETPLDYDYLARPLRLRPTTLSAMPEVSADGGGCREQQQGRQRVVQLHPLTTTESAERLAGPWKTASTLLPSGSKTNAP